MPDTDNPMFAEIPADNSLRLGSAMRLSRGGLSIPSKAEINIRGRPDR